MEDDLLGADGADRELGLGALHPALLGEALDAGGGAVVVAGPALARVGALSAAGGVLRGITHRSEQAFVRESLGGSTRVVADPTGGNAGITQNMPGSPETGTFGASARQ